MKRPYALFVFFYLLVSIALGQSNPRLPFLDDPLPKTPEVSSLFRYAPQAFGNTGKINVAVPIYTVSVDEVQLPISIAYQNDGLKVAELPSRVGHGWTLTAGGSISRQVRGLPDEVANGMLNPAMRQKAKDYADNAMSSTVKNNYLGSVAIGLYDSEFDVFSFQIGGLSGSFFIDINGVVRIYSARDIKVTYDSNFNQFTIIDESGTTYIFAEREMTIREAEGGYIWQISGASAWHISSIQTYQGKTITFNYVLEQYTRNDYFRTDKFRHTSSLSSFCNDAGGTQLYNSTITQNPKQLSSIVYPMGKVVFNQGAIRADATDYADGLSTQTCRTLSSIELRDYQNTVLKTYELSHGYFGTTGSRRLKLQAVSEKSQGQTGQVYSFLYYNENSSFPLMKYESYTQTPSSYFSQDHWGYYNGKSNQSLIPTINMQTEVNPILDASSRSIQADRRADGVYSQYGMLQQMTLPTKGKINYEYESNRVYYDGCGNVPLFMQQANTSGGNQNCDLPYFVGGMRVKKEAVCPDESNTNCIQRLVTYETITGGVVANGGTLYAIPEYLSNANFYLCSETPAITSKDSTKTPPITNLAGCPQVGSCVEYYCYSTTLADHNLSSTGGGNIVEYPRIEVLDGINGEAGKTVSWYNVSSKQGSRLFPYPIIWVKTWESTLATQISYRNFGGSFKPLLKTENTYVTDNLNSNYYDVSPKVGVTLSNQSYLCQLYYVNDQYLGQPFHRLSQSTSTEYTYDGSGTLTDELKVYQYYYHENLNKHVQLTRSIVAYPNLQKEETFYRYPADFTLGTPTDNETQGVADLQNRNRHVPLEIYVKSYDYNDTFTGYSSAQTLTHILRNGKAFPYELFNLKAPNTIFTPLNYATTLSKDGNYERAVQYQIYDAQNNRVQQTDKTQLTQSFVYGYPSQSKLIIEGKNVSYSSLIGANGSLPSYSDETSIHNAGNTLRSTFSTALIQSIGHTPMVGVASMGQANSLKPSFGYDSFLRLLSVKDPNGNISDYFRYSYATTPAPPPTPSNLQWDGSRNTCSNTDGVNSVFRVFVIGIGTGASVEFSIDGSTWYAANYGIDGYQVSVPYNGGGVQYFAARPSDNPSGGVITGYLSKCAFSGGVAAPTISLTSSSLCSLTLTASGCGGTVNWSNGSSGASISVPSTTTTTYTATCTVGASTSSASSPLTLPTLPSGWSSADIGNPTAGCTQVTSGNVELLGNGNVGGSNDAFHWINKPFSGDVTIIAKINAMPSDDGDRSGIMLRSSTATNAKFYTLIQDGNANVGELKRDTDGGSGGLYSYHPSAVNQTWIKVVKTATSIKGYHSTDSNPEANNAWNPYFNLTGTTPTSLDFGSNYLIGFVTWGTSNQTTFTNITINGQAF